jgi:hypothetical protein
MYQQEGVEGASRGAVDSALRNTSVGTSAGVRETPRTCSLEPTGSLGEKLLRCTSWEAILWDYFYYIEEVPQSEWQPKDFSSFNFARASFGKIETQHLHEQFKRQYIVES